ncbi:MAG: hypothetical protein WCP69_00870 [Bacteroidota bacterium]
MTKKRVFFLIYLLSIIIFSCTTKTKDKNCDNAIKNIATHETFINRKIVTTIYEMVKKYDLPYLPCGADKYSIKIQDVYVKVKKVYYPNDDLTLEYWFYGCNCHITVELIVCYRNDVVSCIPFYNKHYFLGQFKLLSSYTAVLEKELNTTYKKLYTTNNIDSHDKSHAYRFVRHIMENIGTYNLNIIEHDSELESVRFITSKLNFNHSDISISKANALKNIDEVSKNMNNGNPYEYLYFSIRGKMIIEVKINNENNDIQKFKVKTINYELINEYPL